MATLWAEIDVYKLYLITFKTAISKPIFISVLSSSVQPTSLIFNCFFFVTYCL
jgi:hypothetical protein